MSDGDSCRLKYFEGEPEVLAQVRQMWDEIFDDPEEFADYYFTEICRKNKILLAYKDGVLAGMIHLNQYEMQIDGKKELCYYIVGVAVKPEYREQGIMRSMMHRVLADMKQEGRKFTFLMPEREEYYESLGFEKVFHTLELDIDIEELEDEDVVPDDLSGEEGYYTRNLRDLHEERTDILEHLSGEVNAALAKKYQIYAYRTPQYLEEMCKEHRCQNGDVVAVYEDGMRMDDGQVEERLAGLFSYDIYDDTMYVERFESFDEHVRYVLDAAVRLAEQAFCRRLVVTMSEKHFCDDIVNMLGVSVRMNEGHGFMALTLKDRDVLMPMLHDGSFFDEIV